jgi:hemoglobin
MNANQIDVPGLSVPRRPAIQVHWCRFVPALAAISLASLTFTGCAANEETRVTSSGDPEADQRAEQRVGSEGRDGKDKAEQTLYERLGGVAGIAALVDDMTIRSIADPRVNFERKDVRSGLLGRRYKPWEANSGNTDRFKRHMIEFLTLATGGPAQYTGGELRAVHRGMKITNNEFDAMVGDIKTSMDKLGMAAREKRDLLAIIESTRKQIVEEP